MVTKIIFSIALFAITIHAQAQKLVRTYWDWSKTKIQKEYYTDAYGTLIGPYKAYSEYGGIMKQGQCKDDGPIGKWIENYDNGKLHYIKIYDTPGTNDFRVINGKVISYYEDGKSIKYERNFKELELDGVWKEYDEKGNIIKEGIYTNGVFEPTGISKIKFEEEQEKERKIQAEIQLKKAEDYKKIIPEADSAYLAKDYPNALILYRKASDLMGTDKYSDDKIAEIIDTCLANRDNLYDYWHSQYDSVKSEYRMQTGAYKLVVVKLQPNQSYSLSYQYQYDKMNQNPCWKVNDLDYIGNWESAKKCFNDNRGFYEPFQMAFVEGALNYWAAINIEEKKVKGTSYYYKCKVKNTNYQFYHYDKNTFLSNLKDAKKNYELGKSVIYLINNVMEKGNTIRALNNQNKKKRLFKKYLIVFEDLIARYNAYTSMAETINVLNTLSLLSDKVIVYYSQDTKELESKLKEAETSEQIQTILFGQ